MVGWFGGAASSPDPKVAAELESQIEMMDIVFREYSYIWSYVCDAAVR